MRIGHRSRIRIRKEILHQCMETAEAPLRQHGHPRCDQHRDRISVQPFQPGFPEFLAFQRDRATPLFRGIERNHSLHPARTAIRRQGEAEDYRGNPQTRRTAAQDSDSGPLQRERMRHPDRNVNSSGAGPSRGYDNSEARRKNCLGRYSVRR